MEISGQVDRASDIINHTRAFGRKSDLALLDTDINGVVAQATICSAASSWCGITLETSLVRPCCLSSPSPTVWNR
ncbi:MAG: hypothetical protein ACLSHC_14155 [Bilophila wadsworthia]